MVGEVNLKNKMRSEMKPFGGGGGGSGPDPGRGGCGGGPPPGGRGAHVHGQTVCICVDMPHIDAIKAQWAGPSMHPCLDA